MISQWGLENFLKKKREDASYPAFLSDDGNVVFRNSNITIPIKDFLIEIRKKEHCNFEEIWGCHATLQSTLRCCECGTVIFASDDCNYYDDKLACPTCGGYHTDFEYWTKEEIESDPKKKETIEWMIQDTKEQEEEYERMKKRGGLYDHQRWVKKFKNKKRMIIISHICYGWGKKGVKKQRYLEISRWINDEDHMGYIHGGKGTWTIKIPMNFYAMYILWIIPHTKKYKKAKALLYNKTNDN